MGRTHKAHEAKVDAIADEDFRQFIDDAACVVSTEDKLMASTVDVFEDPSNPAHRQALAAFLTSTELDVADAARRRLTTTATRDVES